MKGYTIQHSIELLEKEVGSGSGGASTAAQVSYNNTDSGLVATNVQNALDEIDGNVDTLSGTVGDMGGYGTEVLIGKLGNDNLYRSVISIDAFPSTPFTNVAYPHGIANIDKIISIGGVMRLSTGTTYPINVTQFYGTGTTPTLGGATITCYADPTNVNIMVGTDRSAASGYVVLVYTKAAPVTNTRSKKSKKEE